jgi:hypothetical protein
MVDIHEIALAVREDELNNKVTSMINTLYSSNAHYHKCGYPSDPSRRKDEDPPPSVKGCGFEWAHDKPVDVDVSSAMYVERHMCPMCGAGPWYIMPPAHALDPPRELPLYGALAPDAPLLAIIAGGGGAVLTVGFIRHDEKEANGDHADILAQMLSQLTR